jgi:organic radical activating enzyme
MAMLHGVDRAIERGSVSRHAVKRLVDVFVGNVLLRHDEDADLVARLGFVPPKFILVSPTGTCNLRCVGCYAESDPGSHASLDFDTFDRILTEKRKLWGSYFTVISGGEPFLWRDGERDLLDMVSRHDSDFFMVYTNGTLIDDETARRMAELGNISPAVSVEGFEEETDARRGKGTHRKVLAAFDNLRKHGVPFGVSVTPTRDNWDVITSDRFADFYFDEQGAIYGWWSLPRIVWRCCGGCSDSFGSERCSWGTSGTAGQPPVAVYPRVVAVVGTSISTGTGTSLPARSCPIPRTTSTGSTRAGGI